MSGGVVSGVCCEWRLLCVHGTIIVHTYKMDAPLC